MCKVCAGFGGRPCLRGPQEEGILNTPLTPFIDKELLYNNHVAVDGTAIQATGFTYNHPKVGISTPAAPLTPRR